jgi:ring-1,2-phenylacetyl-CoA epoxidase subunit PaaC
VNTDAIKNLLLRMADDELIMAHRHSEWTGFGPILEEDIAFSSIAQDKLGHSQALYQILHEHFGAAQPDDQAFGRTEKEFVSSHFVEVPNGEYDFSLMRHFLFDAAEFIRYDMLRTSTFEPIAKLARKIRGELKYHLYHGQTWVVQLGAQGTEDSHNRMQAALNEAWPLALGLFEPSPFDAALADEGVFPGEAAAKDAWLEFITPILEQAHLSIPSDAQPTYGGRTGSHTEHLQPLLDEMTEVYRIDPAAEW